MADAITAGLEEGDLDERLAGCWRWRDDDAAEMHWFASDLGAGGRAGPLEVQIIRDLAADPNGTARLRRLHNHELRPSELFTPASRRGGNRASRARATARAAGALRRARSPAAKPAPALTRRAPSPGPSVTGVERSRAASGAGVSNEIDVRLARDEDVPRLAQVLAAAFLEDRVFEWLLPRDRRRAARLSRFFEVELRAVGLARGGVWTTAELSGAAITTPPGHWRLPWRTALRHAPDFTRAFGARLPHALTLLQLMEHHHIREPHHYLPYIGVAPACQGQGLGTSLMLPTLERCDQQGLPAYLEATSPRNAALYTRLGFEQLSELTLGSSPPVILMKRSPRR